MKKAAKRFRRYFCLVIGCICLAAAGIRFAASWRIMDTIRQNLAQEAFIPLTSSYNNESEYAGLPLEATDFAGFTPLLASAQTLEFHEGIVREYTLPCDISYYSWDGSDKIPALVLHKGTKILFFPTKAEGTPLIPAGYGIRNFPGAEPGWRYAVPFITADQPLMDEQVLLSQQDWDYYHVRLSDLEAACSGYWKELEWNASLQNRRRMGMSIRELCAIQLLQTDAVLYRAGIYQSPDLSVPLWDSKNTLLTVAGEGMLILFLVGYGPKRRLANM